MISLDELNSICHSALDQSPYSCTLLMPGPGIVRVFFTLDDYKDFNCKTLLTSATISLDNIPVSKLPEVVMTYTIKCSESLKKDLGITGDNWAGQFYVSIHRSHLSHELIVNVMGKLANISAEIAKRDFKLKLKEELA